MLLSHSVMRMRFHWHLAAYREHCECGELTRTRRAGARGPGRGGEGRARTGFLVAGPSRDFGRDFGVGGCYPSPDTTVSTGDASANHLDST